MSNPITRMFFWPALLVLVPVASGFLNLEWLQNLSLFTQTVAIILMLALGVGNIGEYFELESIREYKQKEGRSWRGEAPKDLSQTRKQGNLNYAMSKKLYPAQRTVSRSLVILGLILLAALGSFWYPLAVLILFIGLVGSKEAAVSLFVEVYDPEELKDAADS